MGGRIVYVPDLPAPSRPGLFESAPDVLTTAQAAGLLGVAPITVRREINKGHLTASHVGRCVRITKRALVDYLEGGGCHGPEAHVQ